MDTFDLLIYGIILLTLAAALYLRRNADRIYRQERDQDWDKFLRYRMERDEQADERTEKAPHLETFW